MIVVLTLGSLPKTSNHVRARIPKAAQIQNPDTLPSGSKRLQKDTQPVIVSQNVSVTVNSQIA